ncbi:hypothetical protein STIUS_v1c01980 [Spiroplasma sp. TIUS-1]|uniref:ATP-binding protein n=1 Tax=Spiroplasma sp. TIUS-1 TaxID=216963 RepID=UPI0013976939|nr:ATP-binding protein [Spiroplasma sp. TIUS-1]QHX35753.1 hypothetical protein STIUS_v1c01980 [Spiroplasma sp. TIUS-1]
MENKNSNYKALDIRPKTSIFETYKKYNYKPHFALAEFVDNSTASFFDNKETLNEFYSSKGINGFQLKVYILYIKNETGLKIQIIDNAFGMDSANFRRAIVLGEKPKIKTGRNEFGMGLKTAATWFANKWSIKSTQLGSNEEYSVVMDIDNIVETGVDSVNVITNSVDENKHYTILTLEKLNKTLPNRNKKNLMNLLTGIYRKDILDQNISIVYAENMGGKWEDVNGNKYDKFQHIPPFSYEPVKPRIIKVGELPNVEEGTVCVKQIDETLVFNGISHKITGFIGLRDKGSRALAGFALFRRGRAIIGGFENNYRPKEIYGDSGSYTYQRLYGDINLDSFPVNQAKDGFSWDDGLEEAFIEMLIPICKEYKSIANKLRVNEESAHNNISIEQANASNQILEKVLGGTITSIDNLKSSNDIAPEILAMYSEDIKEYNNKLSSKHLDSKIVFKSGDKLNIEMFFKINTNPNPKEWLNISVLDEEFRQYKFSLNIEHKFFKPFSENSEFIIFIKDFASAYAASIIKSRVGSPSNMVDPISITDSINKYLIALAEEQNMQQVEE